jgi:signal peptidase I
MDFNAYNTRVTRKEAIDLDSLKTNSQRTGLHWVGDLMVEADVEVEEARGELVLDLVEGGQHFTCEIDLTNGQAKLSAGELTDFAPTATTIVTEPGSYRVGFANVDDKLLLFVKKASLLFSEFGPDDLVAFDSDTSYDAEEVFGPREEIVPVTGELDPGDLAPAGVGAKGAKLAVSRLQMWRDIYYIADSWRNDRRMAISDFDNLSEQDAAQLPFKPSTWRIFRYRRREQFELGADQFFVMGDNSPESSDARLWRSNPRGGRPGGDYLERRLLIGKALCVYWPHSWYSIPATPIPLFPNFADMRLVR